MKPHKPESRLRTFLSFFLISCVLGLGVRLYFAPERLTPFLQKKINESFPQFKIGFKSVQIILADGLLPALSLEIKDIEIANMKSCQAILPPIRIQRALLPISFFKLLTGKLALSQISIQKIEVDIEHFQNTCPESSGASVAADLVSPPQTMVTSLPIKHESVFWDDQALSKIDEIISGAEFDEIKFYFDHRQKFLLFKNFNLRQNKKQESLKTSYRLKSEFVLPPEYSQGEVLPTAVILADLTSEKISVDISTQVSEGHIQVDSIITPDSHGPLLDLNMEAKQLPVSALANYMVKMGLLPPNTQPKFVWLNFSATIKGKLDQLKQLPIEITDVLLDGEFGQAKILHLVRNSDGSFSNFAIDLPKVNVQKALDLFSAKGPDGIFSQFGELNGQLNFKSIKNFEFKGEWRDATLKFSRRGSRSEQQIENVKLDLSFAENRWQGRISNVELENGEFEGEIKIKFDPSFDEGEIEIASENLEFDPAVQKIMFLGSISGIKINGKMALKKFLVRSWDGELQIKSLETDELSFKRARLLSHFGEDKLSLTAKLAEGEYKYTSNIRRTIKQLFLGFEDKGENLVFTNMKADLFQIAGSWSWKGLRASLLEDRVQISSSGSATVDDILSGNINLDFPKVKKIVWNFTGGLDDLKLGADSNNLKSLMIKKADFSALGLSEK